ncbi:MAG: tetratricopeptide repeat protein [Spirulina sp. SIO3F2]|nr:tetratricopeptide repeat protein [Spirulina sp. SIO3F2]
MGLAMKVWTGLVVGVCVAGFSSPTIGSGQRASLSLAGWDGIAVAQTVEAQQAEADRLYALGGQQFENQDYQAALETLQQAHAIYEEINYSPGIAATNVLIGYVHAGLGQMEEAQELFEFLLSWGQDIRSSELEGAAQKGLDYLQQLAALADPRFAEATTLFEQGQAQHQASQFQAALTLLGQALILFRETENRQAEAATLNSLGIVYRSLGQYQQALTFHEQSLEITPEINDRQGEAVALHNLGLVYRSLGQYQKAIALHEQSLDLEQELNNRQGEAYALASLGSVYHLLGQYQKALTFQEQSLDIARQINDRQGEANSLGNLGIVYFYLGQYQQAITLNEQFLDIAQQINDQSGEVSALGNLSIVYQALGQYQQAITLNEQSLEIARQIGNRQGEANVLGSLGNIYFSLGQYPQAIAFHEQSLGIQQELGNRQGEAGIFSSLGNTYFTLGQHQQALVFHEQSLEITRELGNRQGEAISLDGLGLAYASLGQHQQAIAFHEQSLVIKRAIGARKGEAVSLNNLGFALQNLDRHSEAEQKFLAAAELWETIRADLGGNDTHKVSIFEQQSTTYQLLQQVQIAQNKTTAALETAERGRARAFVELLATRLNADGSNVDIAPPNLSQIQQIAHEKNATLVEYSITVDTFDLDNNPGTETTKESALYIWVIPPNGDITFRQVDLTPLWRDDDLSLWELVQFTRDALGVRGLNLRNLNRLVAVRPRDPQKQKLTDDDQLLRKLHSLLIEPIADLLPQDPEDRVIFIPQSSLFLVPFPALKNAAGEYLIQNHTILTAPSIQTLSLTRTQKQQSPQGDGALIVGNPTMPSIAPDFGETPQPLTQLPGAEQEAKAIADLLDTNAITGNAANKSAMVAQMQDAELIHLATHGLLDDIRGIGSAIALAPDPNFQPEPGQVNGLLTAEEIFDLNLKADLVVLSACDTGRGRITGDGVVGLSRSFIAAGVPSVLVSLWQVPDAPTAQLMTEFYRQREQTGDNAQALRQAMLQTLERHPEPRNWAAFTLIGEAN